MNRGRVAHGLDSERNSEPGALLALAPDVQSTSCVARRPASSSSCVQQASRKIFACSSPKIARARAGASRHRISRYAILCASVPVGRSPRPGGRRRITSENPPARLLHAGGRGGLGETAAFPAPSQGAISCSNPGANWLTCSISGSTLTLGAATGQTSHRVIGTCASATSFAPCSLEVTDLPARSSRARHRSLATAL